jgi:hypothetical protein
MLSLLCIPHPLLLRILPYLPRLISSHHILRSSSPLPKIVRTTSTFPQGTFARRAIHSDRGYGGETSQQNQQGRKRCESGRKGKNVCCCHRAATEGLGSHSSVCGVLYSNVGLIQLVEVYDARLTFTRLLFMYSNGKELSLARESKPA